MLAMNSTLLVGPSDWDADRMPKAEFVARAGAFWRDNPPASGAIVYGDRVNHAELAYLTNFTPKLEAALALIPRDGAPQLLVGGGVNMLPAARPLTFVEDLRPLRNVGSTVAKWSHEQDGGAPVLIGGGFMPYALHQEIAAALSGEMDDKTAELRRLMGRKSARELAAQRETCAALDAAVAAMRAAQDSGAEVTAAVLAGEQAANRRGRTGGPHAVQPRRRAHAASVRHLGRTRGRSAAGLCRGPQAWLLGGRVRRSHRLAPSVRGTRTRSPAIRRRADASRRTLRRACAQYCAGGPAASSHHDRGGGKRDRSGARGASGHFHRMR